MLFKRVLEGKSALSKSGLKKTEMDISKRGQLETCSDIEESNVLEEVMRVIVIAIGIWTAWIGVSFASTALLPYPYNMIVSSDIRYPPPVYEIPYPSASALAKLPPVKEKHLNLTLSLGRSNVEMMRRFEETLVNAGIVVELSTPEHGFYIQGYPRDEAIMVHKWSAAITKASLNLAHNYCGKYGVNAEECGSYISKFLLGNTEVGEKCALLNQKKCSASRMASKYRSFDGVCNNVKRAYLGKAMTGFKRLLHPKYADGIKEPRKMSHNSVKPLPGARTISAGLVSDLEFPDAKHTQALVEWTQFVENDLVHIPVRKMVHTGHTITCCDRWGRALAPRYQHPSCMAMSVSGNDPFYSSHRVTCLPYVRSVTTFRSDCTFGAVEQMNQATHFLDGSSIYGSNLETATGLRSKKGGLMQVEKHGDEIFPPQVHNPREKCQVDSNDEACFKTGDVRTNGNPRTAALHTLWLREHNRVASTLAELNPTWKDDQLYHEARRIVTAQIQHVTYSHWLPAITGISFNETKSANDLSYNPETEPTISNAFATVGLRFVNTLMGGTVDLVNEDGSSNASLDLMRHFNNPTLLRQPERMHQVVRGMALRQSQSMDFHLPDDLTEKLYANKHNSGFDILSLDIQRGRDHGLPPYHQYRMLCGLRHANEFSDFSDSITYNNIDSLKKWYSHPYDVDLIVGALAESPVEGGIVGPTFACLMEEQLKRSRTSDRYFYSNSEQPEPFTQNQLKQIHKSSLARIFCDNTPGLTEVQVHVFSSVSDSNPMVSCNSGIIKKMNLVAWQDPSHKPDIITRTKRNVDKWIKDIA